MIEELWILLRAILGFLAEIPPIVSRAVAGLISTADGLLEDLGGVIGHENGLFLPAGKGASILILGGIAMVVISLSIALYISPRATLKGSPPSTGTGRSGPGADGTGEAWARFSAAHADPMPDPAWLEGLRKIVAQSNLGEVVLLSERSGRRAVAIPSCSGPDARQGAPTCHHAGQLIRTGLQAVEPQGRVVPVSCKAQGGQACVFEIRTGGTLP